jgi:hypothetical protein
MSKTINFKTPVRPTSAEEWVRNARPLDREAPAAGTGEPMKRFTIDVPLDLHTRVKVGCARRGLKMADLLRELLEREFPKA